MLGEAGDQGLSIDGEPGWQGVQGEPGWAGLNGTAGLPGLPGDRGFDGFNVRIIILQLQLLLTFA